MMLQSVNTRNAEVIKVVKTRLTMRGEGKLANDPLRMITQYWSLEGELLAEEEDNWAKPKEVHCKNCGFLVRGKKWEHTSANRACKHPEA